MRGGPVVLLAVCLLAPGCLEGGPSRSGYVTLDAGDDPWTKDSCDPDPDSVASSPMAVHWLFALPQEEAKERVADALGWESEEVGEVLFQSPWFPSTMDIDGPLDITMDDAEARIRGILGRLGQEPPVGLEVADGGSAQWLPRIPASWPQDVPLHWTLKGRASFADWDGSLSIPVAFHWPDWPAADVRGQADATALVESFVRCWTLREGWGEGTVRVGAEPDSIGASRARLALAYAGTFGDGSGYDCPQGGGCPHPCPPAPFTVWLDARTGAVLGIDWQLCI